MATQHNKKALFFTLLKCDTADRVEESAEFVSELPARVAACLDASVPSERTATFQTVRECILAFVAEQRLGYHEPTDFKAYCDEADISHAKGSNDRALGFLGRALEVVLFFWGVCHTILATHAANHVPHTGCSNPVCHAFTGRAAAPPPHRGAPARTARPARRAGRAASHPLAALWPAVY